MTFQIRVALKFSSNASIQFEDLVSDWKIFVHERDQIAWDYSNLFGSSYLGFIDSHIPMYNKSHSLWAPYTIIYDDVTMLNKADKPCSDDPGFFQRKCYRSHIFNLTSFQNLTTLNAFCCTWRGNWVVTLLG